MNIEGLKQTDRRYREENPGLFEATTPDKPATEQQLEDVERSIGVRLPPSYRAFLREFGGGTYGYIVVFPADPDGAWYLPNQQRNASRYLPEGLLAFCDDYAGGNVEGEAQEAIFYWTPDRGGAPTEFNDTMLFVARYAYEPA